MIFFILMITFILLQSNLGQYCPAQYKRLSTEHSFCKPRNPKCQIITSGLANKIVEIQQILHEHNTYRSRCAMGRETRAGSLPPASDMLEMVWDEELAAVAQKWAEQCDYRHDCRDCRAIFSYGVGQNIAYKEWTCPQGDCIAQDKRHPRNWAGIIKMFYDEVDVFDKSLIPSVIFPKTVTIGHFTQVIWAKSWRIGCGYVSYVNVNKYRQYYVCNYGPGGNLLLKPVYTIGQPCINCPLNSCCGSSCKGQHYPGLCHLFDPNSVPIAPFQNKGTIFFCDFAIYNKKECKLEARGSNNWLNIPTLSGNVLSIILKGGESSTATFMKSFAPTKSFCLVLIYRKGPDQAGTQDSSRFTLLFRPEMYLPVTIPVSKSSTEFISYNFDLQWKGKTEFSIKFEVPPNAPPQYLNVLSVAVYDYTCKDVKHQ